MTMRTHNLKTWPLSFAKVAEGIKRAEYRKLDRDYAVGDTLLLQEFDPETSTYTGREVYAIVLDITTGYGIPDGFGMLSIDLCSKVESRTVSDDHREIIGRSSDDRFRIVFGEFFMAREASGTFHWTRNPDHAQGFKFEADARAFISESQIMDNDGVIRPAREIAGIDVEEIG